IQSRSIRNVAFKPPKEALNQNPSQSGSQFMSLRPSSLNWAENGLAAYEMMLPVPDPETNLHRIKKGGWPLLLAVRRSEQVR
ncbi:hypothetical protein ACFFNA_35505, partial [Mesorhizobium kowhaii]|uniref:hypothetical protein n=1 Tax=Mesorhizobium kowhaii TaxID=1300272 RepID=UPI0035EF105F